jgi:hypothetical protein
MVVTPHLEDVWGSGGIVPPFLTSALDGGEWPALLPCRFTLRGKTPRFLVGRMLDEPQGQSGRYGEEKSLFPLTRMEPQLLGTPPRSLVPMSTELSWLPVILCDLYKQLHYIYV